ncbi:MAG: hypothetical protein WCH74_13785 [Chloroflexota bacterium]
MSRHQTRRRRLYGRRLHDLRERRERVTTTDANGLVCHVGFDSDLLAEPDLRRMTIPIVADDRTGDGLVGLPLGFVALD